MHPLAKKFMMARKLDFGEKGIAELLDDEVFLMDGSMLLEITAEAGDDVSYSIGRAVGEKLAANVKSTGISGTKMTDFMTDLLTMMGLGNFEMHDFDIKTKEGELRLENSLISRECGSDDEITGCSVIAGLIAGVFSQNYDTGFKAEEVGCVIQGDDLCRFKIQVAE